VLLSSDNDVIQLAECAQLFRVVTQEYNLVHTFDITYVIYFIDRHFYVCATATCWRDTWAAYHFPAVNIHLGPFWDPALWEPSRKVLGHGYLASGGPKHARHTAPACLSSTSCATDIRLTQPVAVCGCAAPCPSGRRGFVKRHTYNVTGTSCATDKHKTKNRSKRSTFPNFLDEKWLF